MTVFVLQMRWLVSPAHLCCPKQLQYAPQTLAYVKLILTVNVGVEDDKLSKLKIHRLHHGIWNRTCPEEKYLMSLQAKYSLRAQLRETTATVSPP